jgi:hypothetical protein
MVECVFRPGEIVTVKNLKGPLMKVCHGKDYCRATPDCVLVGVYWFDTRNRMRKQEFPEPHLERVEGLN